jgi:hypothetical protein
VRDHQAIDEDDDPSCFDYVFPIVISKVGEAACVAKWTPGSDVEVAWNKGDDAREVTRHTQRGALAWSRLFWRQIIGPFLRSRICTDSFSFFKKNK